LQGDEDTEGSQDSPAADEKPPGMLSEAMLVPKHIARLLPACRLHVHDEHATVQDSSIFNAATMLQRTE